MDSLIIADCFRLHINQPSKGSLYENEKTERYGPKKALMKALVYELAEVYPKIKDDETYI